MRLIPLSRDSDNTPWHYQAQALLSDIFQPFCQDFFSFLTQALRCEIRDWSE